MTRRAASLRVNARFDANYEKKLKLASRRLGLSVSDTLKAGLDSLVESLERGIRPYDALKKAGLIGFVSGPGDASVNYKKRLAESIARKHGHR